MDEAGRLHLPSRGIVLADPIRQRLGAHSIMTNSRAEHRRPTGRHTVAPVAQRQPAEWACPGNRDAETCSTSLNPRNRLVSLTIGYATGPGSPASGRWLGAR